MSETHWKIAKLGYALIDRRSLTNTFWRVVDQRHFLSIALSFHQGAKFYFHLLLLILIIKKNEKEMKKKLYNLPWLQCLWPSSSIFFNLTICEVLRLNAPEWVPSLRRLHRNTLNFYWADFCRLLCSAKALIFWTIISFISEKLEEGWG